MKEKLNKILKIDSAVWLFVGIEALILWQLLLPGYILTLDMVWGGIWITQKLFLIVLFFLLFYLPYRFFPFEIDSKFKYWAAIFYAINPFVYERFLAGHWLVLLLYALLPPLIYYLIRLFKNFKKYCPYFIFWLLAAVLAFSFYFDHFIKVIKISNPEYWQVFKTASFPIGGSLAKVAMLYGFWGESYPWANYFIWPKLFIILPVFALIAGLIILGIRKAWFQNKRLTVLLLVVGFLSFVFASGIGEGLFKNFNLWLFENIPFWRVFRDTTKWLGPLAYVYAVFGALGVSAASHAFFRSDGGDAEFRKASPASGVLASGQNKRSSLNQTLKKAWLVALFILPLLYTYPMLGGFARQIQPVWYPESWVEVNNILKQDKECKALFLPWHLYYSLSFNNNLVTANPAAKFFNCQIISSQDIEIGEIERTAWPDWQDKAEKIKYIIYTPDLEGADIYDYSFLNSDALEVIYQHKDIILYKIQPR